MNWYYSDASGRNGPVSEDAFNELVRSGVIGPATLVWNDTMADWKPFGETRPAGPPALPNLMSTAPAGAAGAFCSECGRQAAAAELVPIAGRPVCSSCKPAVLQKMREGTMPLAGRYVYAGFWIRFAAAMIDSIIIGAVNVALMAVIVGGLATSGDPTAGGAAVLLTYLLIFGLGAAYEGYFLVNKGATLGKMALGLRVIRPSGAPITWGTGVGRYFSKIVSGMVLGIGYIIAAFDPEKRALHDRMVDTRVIRS